LCTTIFPSSKEVEERNGFQMKKSHRLLTTFSIHSHIYHYVQQHMKANENLKQSLRLPQSPIAYALLLSTFFKAL
jgi:hypothetical protein